MSLSPAQLLQANNAVASLLATMPQRSTISFTALVSSDSFENAVPVVQRETGNQLFAEALYDSAGDPFRFPAEFDLPLGTRLQILAFSDRQNVLLPVNGARGLEVISAEVVSYPNPPATDLDGNVLDDAFETFFLGSTGADPFADSDGDGYTNLQESLEGTNPSSDASFPATAAFAASPPTIDITPGVPGTFDLTVFFPTEYADQIKFTLERSSTLNAFNPSLLEEAVSAGSGEYSLTVSAPGDLEYFYRFRMSLR